MGVLTIGGLLILDLSTVQLVQNLAILSYKILIFAVIIVITWGLGRVSGLVIGRIVSRVGGDSVLRQTVVGRALQRSGYNAYSFTNGLTRWTIYIIGFLVALQSINVSFITDAVTLFLAYLPNLIGALIIFIVGIIASDWVGELIKKSGSPEVRQVLYLSVIGDGVKTVLYFVTITIVLGHLGVDVTILYIITQAFAWAVAIAVGIAAGLVVGWILKDRVKNWLPS
jgi:small-conductance mechanosensitive channel